MGWVPVVVAALALAPLWAIGELGVWSFEEPRSHLRWDEASGASAPQPADEPGGAAGLWGRLAAGALVAGAVVLASWRARAGRQLGAARHDDR